MDHASRSTGLLLAVLVLGACADDPATSTATEPIMLDEPRAPMLVRRPPEKVLISGHSLTDAPLAAYLDEVARSLGNPFVVEEQNLFGTSIRARTWGAAGTEPWSGYRIGRNRLGETRNVLDDLAAPADGKPYDTLVVTERHDLLGSLIWEDTVLHLRHFHDRFVRAYPSGTAYFFESWLGIVDKDQPGAWISYERDATRVWGCVTTRVNAVRARERLGGRIENLPVGWALAELVASATESPGLAGISRGSNRSTIDGLFRDDVHLTDLGAYYVALVTYVGLFGRTPLGAWFPAGVSEEQARSLQSFALAVMSSHPITNSPLSLEACRVHVREVFNARYWAYVMAGEWARGRRWAAFRAALFRLEWRYKYLGEGGANPFRDAGPSDDGRWLDGP